MRSELSTQTLKSFTWPVIAGYVITVTKSWRGGGRRGLVTVSPCGLTRNRGFGPSPYRPGLWTQKLATSFSLDGGTISAVNCNAVTLVFATLPLSRHTRTAQTSHTFISLHSRQPRAGLRIWLCTPVLDIRLRRSR